MQYFIHWIKFVFCSIELSFRFIILFYFSNFMCLEMVKMAACSSTSRLSPMPTTLLLSMMVVLLQMVELPPSLLILTNFI